MRLLGRRAGKLVKRGEFDFYIDQLTKLNEETLETIQEAWEEKGRVGNIFLICSRYGSDHTFILTGQAIDSPVFQWRETDEIKQINSSVWDWFNDWVEDAKAMISLKD